MKPRPRARAADLAPPPSPPPRQRLPRDRTTFVGREADLAAIRRLIEDGAALVTLLGPPGIGKTRLSLRAARSLGGDAIFCDVSDARDAASLLTKVALALDVSIEAPMSNEGLARTIGRVIDLRGDMLLVLDNAEQVVAEAASFVGLWLDAAPAAVLLITSRERLRIPGEHVVALGPLGVPSERETTPEAQLASEAVTLLVDRAARAGFVASPRDAPALAEIARRVEGVPLAIELCAARLGMLDPPQLLERLSRRLDLLASDLRAAPERQANLRGAIDWSWNLLADPERRAFAQVSVFRGGFDLAAAESVLDLGPAPRPSVLDALSALRDKSLLTIAEPPSAAPHETPSPRRYRLYEALREYAAEKLAVAPDEASARAAERHARHFTEAGARWAAEARGAAFQRGLASLARESENLLGAADHSREAGDLDRAVELTLCLEPLAIVRGPVLPYLERLERLLEASQGRLSPRVESRALGSLGVAESRRGRPAPSIACFSRAVDLAASAGDLASLPFLLAKLANQAMVLGDDVTAQNAFSRARSLLDEADDPAVRGVYCRHHAFFLWRAGHVEEAREEGERARALLRDNGDRRELAYVLCDLAASSLDTGDLDATIELLGDALILLRQLQYRRVESRCLLLFALAHREQGRFEEAESDLLRALALPVEDGDRAAEGFALWHLACLSLERGDAEAGHRFAERALDRYTEMGDKHLIAHARMVLGVAKARLEETDAAIAELTLAEALLEGGPPHLRDALALFRAHVPLARAAIAAREGDAHAEAAHRKEARTALHDFDARTTALPLANERFARRLLVRALGDPPPPRRDPRPTPALEAALVVSDDGRWFRLSERREVHLERRAALRRILAALARQRVTAPGTALPLDAVLEAGWPGERVSFEAGAARVYNAIQRLRKLGLETILRTRDDGYLLDAGTETRLAGPLVDETP